MTGSAPSSPFDPRRFGVASVAGRRPVNEDAWSAAPHGGDSAEFYVVADGVGGQERGDVASRMAVDAAVRAFQERRLAGDDPATSLRVAVETANKEVYRLARQLGVERMGCTLAAATLSAGRLDVAHVGDARAYLLEGSHLHHLTKDHTWVQEQVDRGTISAEDAAHHEFRHIVQRVLGNEALVEATFGGPWGMGPGDRLLLTSDGVHDTVGDARMVRLLAGAAPQAAAEALVAEALANGSEDNATALVVAAPAAGAVVAPSSGAPAAVPLGSRHKTERIEAGVAGAAGSAGSSDPAAASAAPRRRSSIGPALLVAALLLSGLLFLAAALTRGGNEPGTILFMPGEEPEGVGAMIVETAVWHPTSTIAAPNPAADGYPDSGEAPPIIAESPVEGHIFLKENGVMIYLLTEEQVGNGNNANCEASPQYRIAGGWVEGGETRDINTLRTNGTCGPLPFIFVRAQVVDSETGEVQDEWVNGWTLESNVDRNP